MQLDGLTELMKDIEANHLDKDQVFIKNVNGDPQISVDIVEDINLIGTVYIIDCLTPDSIKDTLSDAENYVNKRPIAVYCRGSGMYDFSIPNAFNKRTPLTGRPFIHQKWDCYTLLKDFYGNALNITLPEVEYYDEWWKKGDDFYMQLSGVAGFYPVTNLQKYDVIAMRLNSYVFNHTAVYLGNDTIIHHVGGKFSCVEKLRPAYIKSVFGYFRHKDIQVNG